MIRLILVGLVCATVIVGCGARTPVSPDVSAQPPLACQQVQPQYDARYRLWSEWLWYIPESHDRVDLVPVRSGRWHFNVLKWMEEGCTDCLTITSVQKNDDNTIDVTVRLRHPKPGQPEFTGFDVKGIIMFNGSYELPSYGLDSSFPDPFRISWREVGDPELLDPDGYTLRWSPIYDSGSSLPLLNYWPGKYSNGTPTANFNAYMNFYSDENRHMLTHQAVETRVYNIYLPPGPLIAGYAVEACWVPPDTTPVNDPAIDFPISANQDEPFYFRVVVNNDEPITAAGCCGNDYECTNLRVELEQWGDFTMQHMWAYQPAPYERCVLHNIWPCEGDNHPESFRIQNIDIAWGPSPPDYDEGYPDGNYRGWAVAFHNTMTGKDQFVYTVLDFTVDRE